MERLTFEGNFCDIAQCRNVPGGSFCEDGACSQKKVWERLKQFEDAMETPEKFYKMYGEFCLLESALKNYGSHDRMKELAEADKDGRVVVLPCKVGDMVWVIAHPWTDKLQKKPLVAYVNGMKLFPHGLYVNVLFDTIKINGTRDYGISRIGKTVFLTREEAKKAMKGETEK